MKSLSVHTRENCDDVAVLRPVVTLHYQLMGSGDQRQTIVMVESLRDVLSESVTGTTGRNAPSTTVVRVRPQEIAHGAFVGYFLDAVQGSDVIQSVDAGRQASVETEDLVVNQGGQGQVVEEIGEVFPDIGVAILSQTFVVESVDLSNLAGLVVTTENSDALGVSNFECDEEGNGLDGVVTSIDVVTYGLCK